MYKIREVCHHTGLTEKTIRFYIDQKLITPKTEAGLHYKSYRFTDRDIQLLQDISALRSAEFTIAEIRQMLSDPSTIPALVAEKERSLSEHPGIDGALCRQILAECRQLQYLDIYGTPAAYSAAQFNADHLMAFDTE